MALAIPADGHTAESYPSLARRVLGHTQSL